MSPEKSTPKFTLNAAFFQEIKDDHQQLQCVLSRLRELEFNRAAIANHAKEFVELLAGLLDQLAFHFTLEEAYGYFEDALENAPRFHEQAGSLRGQHSTLFVMCQELVDAANTCIAHRDRDLTPVLDRFKAFDRSFKAHESAELNLIMEAMTQDVGVGD